MFSKVRIAKYEMILNGLKHRKSSAPLRAAAVNKTVLSTTNYWADGLSSSATVADKLP